MIEPEVLREAIWPSWIIVLVATAAIYAQAFVRLIFGFGAVIDRSNGIRVSWVQLGWMVFFWLFLFASYWPVVDILAEPNWTFGEFLYMILGAILLFLSAYALAPDATYAEADGEPRYLEISPRFFGLFAAAQLWLVIYGTVIADHRVAVSTAGAAMVLVTVALALNKNLGFHKVASVIVWVGALFIVMAQMAGVIDGALRQGETAPIQGGVITIWLASVVISIALLVMITMAQFVNSRSGFRPYGVHATWCLWLFGWLVLIWWRSPLLVTEGYDYHHFVFFSIPPLLVSIAWIFFMPTATGGDTELAREQYFEKARKAFPLMAIVAAWAIAMNAWLVDGAAATGAIVGWVVALVLFAAVSRSDNRTLHIGVAAFAWALLIAEIALDLDRGVPAL